MSVKNVTLSLLGAAFLLGENPVYAMDKDFLEPSAGDSELRLPRVRMKPYPVTVMQMVDPLDMLVVPSAFNATPLDARDLNVPRERRETSPVNADIRYDFKPLEDNQAMQMVDPLDMLLEPSAFIATPLVARDLNVPRERRETSPVNADIRYDFKLLEDNEVMQMVDPFDIP